MQELIEFMAKGLVDSPDEVNVTIVEGEQAVVYELRVAQGDIGKVIGKEGRIAKSMRSLLKVASVHEQKRAILEII